MAALTMQHPNYSSAAASLAGGVCKIRTELLDQLANAVERLGRAKLDLKSSIDDGDHMHSQFMRGEVEKIRHDCGHIRSQLESHRALHKC